MDPHITTSSKDTTNITGPDQDPSAVPTTPSAASNSTITLAFEALLSTLDPDTFEDGYNGPILPMFQAIERLAVFHKVTPIKNRTWTCAVDEWEILINGLPNKITHQNMTVPAYSVCLSRDRLACAILNPFRIYFIDPAIEEFLFDELICAIEKVIHPNPTASANINHARHTENA